MIFEAVARTTEFDTPKPEKVMIQWVLTAEGMLIPCSSFGKDEQRARLVAAALNEIVDRHKGQAVAELQEQLRSLLGFAECSPPE